MVAALILAADKSNQNDKGPLMMLGSISAVQRLIAVNRRAGAERIVIIGGADFQYLEKHVSGKNVVSLLNEDYAGTQMLDSIKLGLNHLDGKCSRVVISPVDIPLYSVETVERLLQEDADVVIPEHNGSSGHPIILSASAFPRVLAYEGEGGLEAAVRTGLDMASVQVDDRGILVDVERYDDYDDLVEQHSLNETFPEISVYLAGEKRYFGPKIYLLMSLIGECQSLRKACEQMGISYSKGWKMIEDMEKQLGYKLVERQRGGAEKGRSIINPKGREMLTRYQAYTRECNECAQQLYIKHFGADDTRLADKSAPHNQGTTD